MEELLSPVPKEVIKAELTGDKFLRKTNKAGNEIYIITHKNSPAVIQEIGRLREWSFRDAGGGTGKPIDLDEMDLSENPYKQLIVWDPDAEEILGGYRYMLCSEVSYDENKEIELATAHLFHFSEKFSTDYIPYTLELGRSFVQPEYQSSKAGAKALFALDNLWDGLGALTVDHPEIKYLFGKVTMYSHFNTEARNLIQYFFLKYFRDRENLVYPKEPVDFGIDMEKMKAIFTGNDYKEDYKILATAVKQCGESIPPLFNAYMNLSPSMKTFGTVHNKSFGNVLETGIILTVSDLYQVKIGRHIKTYHKNEKPEHYLEFE